MASKEEMTGQRLSVLSSDPIKSFTLGENYLINSRKRWKTEVLYSGGRNAPCYLCSILDGEFYYNIYYVISLNMPCGILNGL